MAARCIGLVFKSWVGVGVGWMDVKRKYWLRRGGRGGGWMMGG